MGLIERVSRCSLFRRKCQIEVIPNHLLFLVFVVRCYCHVKADVLLCVQMRNAEQKSLMSVPAVQHPRCFGRGSGDVPERA